MEDGYTTYNRENATYQENFSSNIKLKFMTTPISNRVLRPSLIGTPEQITNKIIAYSLLLLQFSPHLEEMESYAEKVMLLDESKRTQLVYIKK